MLPQFRKPETDSLRSQPSSSGLSMSAPPPPPAPSALGRAPASFRPGGPSNSSVIGADLVIHGSLTSKGEVQIEGEVQGDINATHVVVGERARITGSILAEEVVVRGHVLGSVRGRRVMLQSSCHVEGDVFHQSLAIEQGAYFEGKSRRVDDPLSGTSIPGDGGPSAPGFPLRGNT